MKLKPTTHKSCVRCDTPLSVSVGQVRALCSPCDFALQTMHYNAEYTLFRRTYYSVSLEGTTLTWLLANGWSKEVGKPPVPKANVLGGQVLESTA